MLTAVVAGWHEGPTAKYMRNRLYTEFLDDTDWQKARKVVPAAGAGECIDTTQMGWCRKYGQRESQEAVLALAVDPQERPSRSRSGRTPQMVQKGVRRRTRLAADAGAPR
jgi:hypothetical protein